MPPSHTSAGSANRKPVALVTGGAHRLGAAIVRRLHQAGMDVLIHYFDSRDEATTLAKQLNQQEPGSAHLLQYDLRQANSCKDLIQEATKIKPRLDALIHNASIYRPSPLEQYDDSVWEGMLELHLQAPLALARHAAAPLRATSGCMVYITDIYARHAKASHGAYCASKAGLDMLVRCLAQQLAPHIRVNAVAPGAIMWVGQEDQDTKAQIVETIPLGHTGQPQHIAAAVRFLVQDASYMTGATITVDGGRSLNI